MKIVVLAGGLSPERDVSLSSGSLIANALRESGHHVVLIDVYEGIKDEVDNLVSLFQDKSGGKYSFKVPEMEPDLKEIKARNNNGDALIGPKVIECCKLADITFIGLHGSMGENGQIQATFDVLGIKYTGTGYLGSLLAMDKDLGKTQMDYADVCTAKWMTINDLSNPVDMILEEIGLPCVVKPCSGGSSIGVSLVDTKDELVEAMDVARHTEKKLIIEEKIVGRELSVGILDGKALPIIEIIPKQGFYDYKNKYQAGFAEEICPAPIDMKLAEDIQRTALRVHKLLHLGTYSRIDFILKDDGEFYCLEANTLPGMTPTSLLPQEAAVIGIEYNQLCQKIVQLSC